MTSVREIQQSAWDAECRRDLDKLLPHFAADAVFHPAGGAPQRGHAAIRQMTEQFYGEYPELSIDILDEWQKSDSASIFEFRAHLTNDSGDKSTLDGVCAVEVDNGLIVSVRYYEDAPVPVS